MARATDRNRVLDMADSERRQSTRWMALGRTVRFRSIVWRTSPHPEGTNRRQCKQPSEQQRHRNDGQRIEILILVAVAGYHLIFLIVPNRRRDRFVGGVEGVVEMRILDRLACGDLFCLVALILLLILLAKRQLGVELFADRF